MNSEPLKYSLDSMRIKCQKALFFPIIKQMQNININFFTSLNISASQRKITRITRYSSATLLTLSPYFSEKHMNVNLKIQKVFSVFTHLDVI